MFDMKNNINLDNKKEDIKDKKEYIIDTLTNLGLHAFSYKDNKYFINLDDMIDNLNKEDLRKIQKLNNKLIKDSYLYNLHVERIKNCSDSYGEYSILKEDIKEDLKDLKKSLNSDKIINKAYDFCKTYNNIKNKTINDEDVKSYKKK